MSDERSTQLKGVERPPLLRHFFLALSSLTCMFAFHIERPIGNHYYVTNADPNADANAKLLLNLCLRQYLFTFRLCGLVLCPTSVMGPLDISVCSSYGVPWEIIISL